MSRFLVFGSNQGDCATKFELSEPITPNTFCVVKPTYFPPVAMVERSVKGHDGLHHKVLFVDFATWKYRNVLAPFTPELWKRLTASNSSVYKSDVEHSDEVLQDERGLISVVYAPPNSISTLTYETMTKFLDNARIPLDDPHSQSSFVWGIFEFLFPKL